MPEWPLPRIIKIILGVEALIKADFSSYCKTVYFRFSLLAYSHSCILGSLVYLKDIKNKTADFIYTKPIHKGAIIYCKLFAAILSPALIAVIIFLAASVTVALKMRSTIYFMQIFLSTVNLLPGQMLFLAISLYISVLCNDIALALNYSLSFLVASFTISVFIDYIPGFGFLKYITPFKYFLLEDTLNLKFDIVCVAITVFVATLCYWLTIKNMKHRDLF
ncbi:MAG: hypothetical protein LBV08_00835 [Clostridiales bacterium]|jgi:ABC-2 type transport system permease protein|nr:hypothetical protein [Clostridiales bacterium]